jgi:hypothetical protein
MPSATTDDVKSSDVQVQLMYLKNDPIYQHVKPIQITPNFADKDHRTNVRLEPGPAETLHDVRGHGGYELGDFTLDDNGFQYVKAPTSFTQWTSQPAIGQYYLPELEELLKREVDGCDEVMFYDARIRQKGDEGLRVEGLSYNPFARQVHTDNTATSMLAKIRSMTDMKADYLLSGRARAINIWRPIKHPVYDCGLAIADGGRLLDDDVMECNRHRADTGEYWDTMGVIKYRPGFEWYYCSQQSPSDVLLFKNFDSESTVRAPICLHTAFDVPAHAIPPNAPTRESIEVRALVFTYPAFGRRPSGALLQHPLALSLEQGGLKRLDDEHSITDRLRTDIDEGNEVKDAMLLLRRKEIQRLEYLNAALEEEKKKALTSAALARNEAKMRAEENELLKIEVRALRAELYPSSFSSNLDPNLLTNSTNHDYSHTSPSVRLARKRYDLPNLPPPPPLDDPERTCLLQTLHRQELELQKWKGQAMKAGQEVVDRSLRGTVDEIVRKMREGDAVVIESLNREIRELKLKLG